MVAGSGEVRDKVGDMPADWENHSEEVAFLPSLLCCGRCHVHKLTWKRNLDHLSFVSATFLRA